MIYVETNSIIGSENLAFEEYFLKKEDIREPVLMLWKIGRASCRERV